MKAVIAVSDMPDAELLDRLQCAAWSYFPASTSTSTGLALDNSRANAPVSIASVGFALASCPVAVNRGWIGRTEGCAYCLKVLRFFRDSEQGDGPEATGYKGFYYHFLDQHSGKRIWRSELSMVDTALLIAGALMASQYFGGSDADEVELRALVRMLYERIEWNWAQDGHQTIWQGWKPECGFLHYGWEGYSEAMVLYALALGSPTHPVGDCYEAWTSTYQWENIYDQDVLYAGPLFVHQFSHAWLDLRGIRDEFMRGKRSDYFENSRRTVLVQREYARRNPRGCGGFDEESWGLSAGDGPSDEQAQVSNETRRLFGYAARGVPFGPDDGTLCPSAVLASVPFAPALATRCLRTMLRRHPEILNDDRLTSGFNPSLSDDGRAWVSPGHYGLDQGIVVLMLENHRSGLPWELMRGCVYVRDGLRRAGFGGGWLDAQVPR